MATLNRHIAPLEKPHSGRSACGLAVIILSQSYRMQSGISRVLRENLSLLTLFKNKQEKQMDAIKEELANVVDTHLFEQAYEYATREKHGNLTVDFRPKCPTLTFRIKHIQFFALVFRRFDRHTEFLGEFLSYGHICLWHLYILHQIFIMVQFCFSFEFINKAIDSRHSPLLLGEFLVYRYFWILLKRTFDSYRLWICFMSSHSSVIYRL